MSFEHSWRASAATSTGSSANFGSTRSSTPLWWETLLCRGRSQPCALQHGALEYRNIDNLLEGGPNDTAGIQFAHVPATLDSLRAMTDWFPMDTLKDLPSDFASAYRQDTADLEQGRLCAPVTWGYSNQCVVFGSAVTQLFLMANLEAWVPTYPSLVLLEHGIFAQLLLRPLRKRLPHRRKVSNSAGFMLCMAETCTALRLRGS